MQLPIGRFWYSADIASFPPAALRQKRSLGQNPSFTLKITVRRRRESITLVYQAPPEKFAKCFAAIG